MIKVASAVLVVGALIAGAAATNGSHEREPRTGAGSRALATPPTAGPGSADW
jgi:hypothetical protein